MESNGNAVCQLATFICHLIMVAGEDVRRGRLDREVTEAPVIDGTANYV
jgi:hypothetical protein